jgi:hypothetical protein
MVSHRAPVSRASESRLTPGFNRNWGARRRAGPATQPAGRNLQGLLPNTHTQADTAAEGSLTESLDTVREHSQGIAPCLQ